MIGIALGNLHPQTVLIAQISAEMRALHFGTILVFLNRMIKKPAGRGDPSVSAKCAGIEAL